MLYYKSGDELGLEIPGDEGKPTQNYDGKMFYPLNKRHPHAKPPNPRVSSKQPPFAANLYNDKDRFINLGSVKPLFSSPYMKALTPRKINTMDDEHVVGNRNYLFDNNNKKKNNHVNDNNNPDNYLNDFLKYKKQDDQVEVKKRQEALKQIVYDPIEHQLPRPPLKPQLNKLGRARKRRQEALLKKYGQSGLKKIFIPKPPRRSRYKTYKRAGRYDIYKQTNDSSNRVRGIRQRRTGRKTIFTEEEETIEKDRSPRGRRNNGDDRSITTFDDEIMTEQSDNNNNGEDFDDTASRITEIGNQLQQALRTMSKNKMKHQHDTNSNVTSTSYTPSISSQSSFGRRRRRRNW